MDSLYKILYELSQTGTLMINRKKSYNLSVNLNKRRANIGKHIIVDRGEVVTLPTTWEKEEIPYDVLIKENDIKTLFPSSGIEDIKTNPYQVIEQLYELYYNSIPNKWSREKKQNLRAKDLQEFKADDFCGMLRSQAQPLLELYILLAGMAGWIKWEDKNYFFWKGEHSLLYIYRKWIMTE